MVAIGVQFTNFWSFTDLYVQWIYSAIVVNAYYGVGLYHADAYTESRLH